MEHRIASITIGTNLRYVEPLQQYVGRLAELVGVDETVRFRLGLLVEEVLSHIFAEAFGGRDDGEVTLEVAQATGDFILRFSYLGLPFGYSWDNLTDEGDLISFKLIRALTSSYSMRQDGKRGQHIELHISTGGGAATAECAGGGLQTADGAGGAADTRRSVDRRPDLRGAVTLRDIREDELQSLVQCLYRVFGYSYSADGVYRPEVIVERLRRGLYRGFVGVNEAGQVVAHVGQLKDAAEDCLVECGQAFVMPEYGGRGLFRRLKQMLIDDATARGYRGVRSSAVTEHPYTQRGNLALGCVETGLELAYIPADLRSTESAERGGQPQSVMNYLFPCGEQTEKTVYVPEVYRDIVSETYARLKMKRCVSWGGGLQTADGAVSWGGGGAATAECAGAVGADTRRSGDRRSNLLDTVTDLHIQMKTEWGQLHVGIERVGQDVVAAFTQLLRQAPLMGARVIYLALDLESPQTPAVVSGLRPLGFVYAGIMPHQLHGHDALMLQHVLGQQLSPDYVLAVSDWGRRIKDFVFREVLKL